MNIQINQVSGLGDCLFCQKIAYFLLNQYDRIYWPVIPQYQYIDKYLAHPSNLIFGPAPDYCEKLDLQNASKHFPKKGIMESKYLLAKVPMGGWQNYIQINRNRERENTLAYSFIDNQKLHVHVCEQPYALVCDTYATPPGTFKADVNPKTKLPIIKIEKHGGDNPFDWLLLIEHATELHLVDSVFVYFAEILNTRAKVMRIYPRSQHEKKVITKGLWCKPWEFVE